MRIFLSLSLLAVVFCHCMAQPLSDGMIRVSTDATDLVIAVGPHGRLYQAYNRPRWQVGHKKIAVQSLGGYFCEGFQRSGSRSRYFSIGVFGGHAAQRSMMSQK